MSESPPGVPHLTPADRGSSGCARALFILIAGFAIVAGLAWLMKGKPEASPPKISNVPVPGQVK